MGAAWSGVVHTHQRAATDTKLANTQKQAMYATPPHLKAGSLEISYLSSKSQAHGGRCVDGGGGEGKGPLPEQIQQSGSDCG